MISKEMEKLGGRDLTSPKEIKQSSKELQIQYQITYLKLQKKLSNQLLKETDETKIAMIRRQREKLGEEYENTLGIIRNLK